MSEVEFLKTIKKNLPDGVKKQFGKVKGVKRSEERRVGKEC